MVSNNSLNIVGKRMKMTYPEYIQDRNIIDRMTYIMLWTTSLLFALTGLIIPVNYIIYIYKESGPTYLKVSPVFLFTKM